MISTHWWNADWETSRLIYRPTNTEIMFDFYNDSIDDPKVKSLDITEEARAELATLQKII